MRAEVERCPDAGSAPPTLALVLKVGKVSQLVAIAVSLDVKLLAAVGSNGNIVKAIERQERIVIIDGRYRLLVFFWRLIPRRIWERLSIHN